MEARKKELKREYKQRHRPMGVYQVRNLVNEKVLVGATLNLSGSFNKQKCQLKTGNHPNRTLQAEWREFGDENFVFEILDELTPRAEPAHDYRADLTFLEDLWLEQLQPYGARGYNEKKKSKEERLRMIARNRAGKE